MTQRITTLGALVLLCGTHSAAIGDAAGKDALKRIDKNANRFKRAHYRYSVTTTGTNKKSVLEVWTKSSRRAAKANPVLMMVSAGPQRDNVVVRSKKGALLRYDPATKKVHAVGPKDRIPGLAVLPAALALSRYRIDYTAVVDTVAGGEINLELKARNKTAPFARIRVTTLDDFRPFQIVYYDRAGKKVLTEKRGGKTVCKLRYCVAGKVTFIDHVANVTSTLTLQKVKINGRLKRNGKKVRFSKRELR
jgi:outer membrane lipoprotein-sorting protein